jgi:hypothetical protein
MFTGGGLDALGITSAPHRMPGRGRWLAWCWGSFAVSVAVVAAVVTAGLSTGDLFIEPLAQLGLFALLPGIRRVRLAVLLADDRYRTVVAPAITTAMLRAAGPSGMREVTVRAGQVGGFSLHWAGLAPAERAFALIQRVHRGSVRSLLTHPSPERRLAACRANGGRS